MRPIARLLILTLSLVLLSSGTILAATPSIIIDGSTLPADVPALVYGSHILVPLRGVFERFGARVWFDAASSTASASLSGSLVQVTVGSKTAWVNGKSRQLDVAPTEVAGRVMIPLRFVAEALGVSVDYDGPSNTVVIVSGQKPGNFVAMTGGSTVTASVPKQAPTVEDQRPASGSLIGSQYPSIYARFNGGTSAVNPSSVTVNVDGQDVTAQSTIASSYVSYTPGEALTSGLHTVSISGAADDGTPFSSSWSFRIDAGTSSDYTQGTYASGAAWTDGFGGVDGFGFPVHGFGHFGFFPPGFSVFTPGTFFVVGGQVVEVIFVSQFFPFGNGFFTIGGIPGTIQLTPWLGFPGFFWGFAQVPFGAHMHNAAITARFTTPSGQKIVVRSTAPLQIEGERRTLPSGLHYAVLPRLVNRPSSPRHAVIFERIAPMTTVGVRQNPVHEHAPIVASHNGNGQVTIHTVPGVHPEPVILHPAPGVIHPAPSVIHPAPGIIHPQPIMHPAPVGLHPPPTVVTHPIIHPVTQPVMPAMPRYPMTQWHMSAPSVETGSETTAKPK